MQNIISQNATIGRRVELEVPVNISDGAEIGFDVKMGRYSYVGAGSHIGQWTEIGRFCSIARDCEIGAVEHPTQFLSSHPFQYNLRHFRRIKGYDAITRVDFDEGRGPTIGHDVWIGAKAVIKRDVSIGHGAIIAAGAVVTKDVAPYEIVTGVPARPLRTRFAPDIIDRLLQAAWWDRDLSELADLPFDDIDRCLDLLEQRA